MNTFSMIAAILVSFLIVTTNAYCGEGANSAGDENWTLVEGADADMLLSVQRSCMAIRPLQWRALNIYDEPGRVVAWVSEDGKNWTEWDTGIVDQDMARIGARSWQDDEVAIVGQTPTEIRLYEMRKSDQKFQKSAVFVPREGMKVGSACMLGKDGGGVRVLSRDAKTPGRILALERRPTGAE